MHGKINGKKALLIGFIVVLLIGIPLTIYLLQQQQDARSRAQKSTNINFSPDSSASNPIQASVGDEIALDIVVNPGSNLVSFVRLEVQYDSEKLATASAQAFQPDTTIFTVQDGPIYSPGKIEVSLSAGPDPTKAIQTATKIATVNFRAIANTPDGAPTLVSYGVTTQVLSIGSSDEASEDVLSSTSPAAIVIGGPGPTDPLPTTEPTPTVEPTPEPTTEPTPTPEPTGPGVTNESPVCSQLAVDRDPNGAAPLAITFTAIGSDTDGTVSSVTFNFGDGQVSDVTTGGGVGTASVSAQLSHTYNSAGTFQATAVMTDNNGGVSGSGSCTQTVSVTGGGGANPTTVVVNPTGVPVELPPTGATENAIALGAILMTFIIGGAFIFFLL